MRVLLLNLPSPVPVYRGFFRSNVANSSFFIPQADLVLLSGALHAAGARVEVVDCIVAGLDLDAAEALVRTGRHDLVVCMVSSSTLSEDLSRLARLCAAASCPIAVLADAAIVAAGLVEKVRAVSERIACVSVEPVHREVTALVESMTGTRRPLVVRDADGRIRMPTPLHHLFKDRRYGFPQSKRWPVTCTQSSFGCRFGCRFCVDGATRPDPEVRAPDDVVEELAAARAAGFREVYFRDLTFGQFREESLAVCRGLSRRAEGLRWLCSSRVDVMDRELVEAMAEAGCYGIEFGVESHDPQTRERMGKVRETERIRSVFGACRDAGIEVTAFVILGLPGEALPPPEGLVGYLLDLGCDWVSFNLLTPFPGTPLVDDPALACQRDELPSAPYHSLEWMADAGQRERLLEYFRTAHARFYTHPAVLLRRLGRLETLGEAYKMARHGAGLVAGAVADRVRQKVTTRTK